jgi:deaminated glutathione amidase
VELGHIRRTHVCTVSTPGEYFGRVMKVAVAQFSAGMDKSANLERIAALTGQAAAGGARLVVFPEAAMCDFGQPGDDLTVMAETLSGRFVDALRRLAVEHSVSILAGMFETIAGERRVYNTAVLVEPVKGSPAVYRKHHLFDAFGDRESERIQPAGDPPSLVEIDGFRVGIAICYDIRFAGFIESIADFGADLLLVPSAWVAGPLKEDQWGVLTRARALDNTMYVAAAGQTGSTYAGRSVIVDPLGVVMASLGAAEGVAVAEISRERLAVVRARLPVVAQRKTPVPER